MTDLELIALAFALWFFVASLIGLITTTTPEKAASNLRKWARWGRDD